MVVFPPGFTRTPDESRKHGYQFYRRTGDGYNRAPPTIHQSVLEIERQVRNIEGATDLLIETDLRTRKDGGFISGQRQPEDPGVVVRFKRHARPFAVPCDRFRTIECNLRAVALMLQASRTMERYGFEIFEEEFRGYAALPEGTGQSYGVIIVEPPLHETLQVQEDAGPDVYRAAWKAWVLKHHPDRGGDSTRFARVKQRWDEYARRLEREATAA